MWPFQNIKGSLRKQQMPARHQHNGFGVQTCKFQRNITSQHIRSLAGLENSTAELGEFARLLTPLKIKPSHAARVLEGNHRPTGSWQDTLQCRALIKCSCCGYWSQSETIGNVSNADFWSKQEGMGLMWNSNGFAFNLVTLVALLFGC